MILEFFVPILFVIGYFSETVETLPINETNGHSTGFSDDVFEVGSEHCRTFFWAHPDCGQVEPMCGSDGVSYDNVCFFQDSFCKNQSITIMAKGSCETNARSCFESCKWTGSSGERICGSNGIIYKDLCNFKNAKCSDKRLEMMDPEGCKEMQIFVRSLKLLSKLDNLEVDSGLPQCLGWTLEQSEVRESKQKKINGSHRSVKNYQRQIASTNSSSAGTNSSTLKTNETDSDNVPGSMLGQSRANGIDLNEENNRLNRTDSLDNFHKQINDFQNLKLKTSSLQDDFGMKFLAATQTTAATETTKATSTLVMTTTTRLTPNIVVEKETMPPNIFSSFSPTTTAGEAATLNLRYNLQSESSPTYTSTITSERIASRSPPTITPSTVTPQSTQISFPIDTSIRQPTTTSTTTAPEITTTFSDNNFSHHHYISSHESISALLNPIVTPENVLANLSNAFENEKNQLSLLTEANSIENNNDSAVSQNHPRIAGAFRNFPQVNFGVSATTTTTTTTANPNGGSSEEFETTPVNLSALSLDDRNIEIFRLANENEKTGNNDQIEIPDASRVEDSAKSRSAFREDLFSDDKEENSFDFSRSLSKLDAELLADSKLSEESKIGVHQLVDTLDSHSWGDLVYSKGLNILEKNAIKHYEPKDRHQRRKRKILDADYWKLKKPRTKLTPETNYGNNQQKPCFGFFNWPTKIIDLFVQLCLKESTRMRPNCQNLKIVFELYQKMVKKDYDKIKSSTKKQESFKHKYSTRKSSKSGTNLAHNLTTANKTISISNSSFLSNRTNEIKAELKSCKSNWKLNGLSFDGCSSKAIDGKCICAIQIEPTTRELTHWRDCKCL